MVWREFYTMNEHEFIYYLIDYYLNLYCVIFCIYSLMSQLELDNKEQHKKNIQQITKNNLYS